jgi:hypothetical protein
MPEGSIAMTHIHHLCEQIVSLLGRGFLRTSENSVKTKFREFYFHVLR